MSSLTPDRSPPEWELTPKAIIVAVLDDGFTGILSRNKNNLKLIEQLKEVIVIKQ